jgi:hypothetical protein
MTANRLIDTPEEARRFDIPNSVQQAQEKLNQAKADLVQAKANFADNRARLRMIGVSSADARRVLTQCHYVSGKRLTFTPCPKGYLKISLGAWLTFSRVDINPQHAPIGDLKEQYELIFDESGPHKAKLWYWKQALWSVGPIFWARAKKICVKPIIGLVTWMVGKGIFGHDSWLATLVEFVKKIVS